MPIPKECKMPDLADLDSPLMNRLIVQLMIGEKDFSSNAAKYRRNFVRLIDKAIREYSEARNLIIAQIKESKRSAAEISEKGRFLLLLGFPDNMETCINAVSRLFKLLFAINREKQSPKLPRDLRKLVQSQRDSIKNVRDSIEHMDEYIQRGEISPGKPLMLSINKEVDGIEISDFNISFENLAMILRNMNEFALYLLTIKSVSELDA